MTTSHYLREALQYIKQGEPGKAVSLLKRLLKSEPENVQAWLLLAHTLQDIALKRKCYLQVLNIDPENERAREKLAAIELSQKEEVDEEAESISPFSTMTFTQEQISERLAMEQALAEAAEEEEKLTGSGQELAVIVASEDEPEEPREKQPEDETLEEPEPVEDTPDWFSEQAEVQEDLEKKKTRSDRNFYILVAILAVIAVVTIGLLLISSLNKNKQPAVVFVSSTPADHTQQATSLAAEPSIEPDTPTASRTPTITRQPTATTEPTATFVISFASETQQPHGGSPTPYPTVIYSSLAEKWARPVLAGDLAVEMCESVIDMARTPVSEDEYLGTLLGIALSIGLLDGANALVIEWIVPEEVADISAELSAEIFEFMTNAERWLDDATDLENLADVLEIGCEDIHAVYDDMLSELEAQGLSYDDVVEAMDDLIAAMEPLETETPGAGFSLEDPFSKDQVVIAQDWEIEVLEYLRGEEAWELLDKPSLYNDPAPYGWEYVMVKVRMKSLHDSGEDMLWVSGLDYNLTGSSHWLYDFVSCAWGTGKVTANCMSVSPMIDFGVYPLPDYDPSVYYINVQVPDPRLDADLETGGETIGWMAFIVREDETDLILKFDDFSSWDDPAYIALEEGASIKPDDEFISRPANTIGEDRDAPANIGDVVITDDWQLKIVDHVRGEDAWQFLHGFSPDDDPAPVGMEYMIFWIEAQYLGMGSDYLSTWNFEILDQDDNIYTTESYSALIPSIDQELLTGGEIEGYLVMLAPAGEDFLVLKYEPWLGLSDSQSRYFIIE